MNMAKFDNNVNIWLASEASVNMARRLISVIGVIIFGVIVIVISINYYYSYHPVRPFYAPQPTAGKLDKFGIKEIYLSKLGGGEEWYFNNYGPQNDPQ